MTAPLVPDPQSIIDNIVRTLTAGLVQAGVVNPVVDPGSDFYLICLALGTQLGVQYQAIVSTADAQMMDTAVGTDLDRLLEVYGLSRRPASPAFGFITYSSSASALIPTNSQLISGFGLLYQVLTGGTYANGDIIEVESLDAGANTNLAVNSTLTWISTPPFGNPNVSVSSAIVGGSDAESDATARARLLSHVANPPSFGNWQQTVELVLNSDPSIQYAFIYPICNGPGSEHIAITRSPTATDKHRDVVTVPVLNNATSVIEGNIPAYVETLTTTVDNVNFDISFGLTIPFPPGATQLGLGGGWANYNPFPVINGTNILFSSVTTVVDSTHFTFLALATGGIADPSLQAGLTEIAWIDRNNASGWIVRTAIITSFSLSYLGSDQGLYTVVIDTPFAGIAANDYISPAAANQQTYLDTVLNQFAQLGPGQKVSLSSLLPRALRKPLTNISYPDQVAGQFLKSLVDSGTEVEDTSFIFRTFDGAEPTVPGSITSPPMIYVPNQIGFYPSL